MILPYINKTDIDKKFTLKRIIPFGLTVEVRKDDVIQSDTILATGTASESKEIIDVSTELSVKPHIAKNYLKCLNGERVSKGDIIAVKKKGVITKEKSIFAPCSGVVNLADIDSGILKLMDVAKETTLSAGVSGKVISVIKNSNVDILCRVNRIKVFKVFGRGVQGEMYILSNACKYEGKKKGDIEIGTNLKGSVVVLKSVFDLKFLRRLATVGVSGVILAGVTTKITNELSSDGLWGMTLCILDAYGKIDIVEQMGYLESNDGSLALIDIEDKELILTNFKDDEKETYSGFVKELENNDRLFLLNEENYGNYAYAVDIRSDKCKVRLHNGRFVEVTYDNVVIVA